MRKLLCVCVVLAGMVASPGAQKATKLHWETIDVPGAVATQLYGINARGDVVGVYTRDGVDHGFLLRKGVIETVDAPETTTFATWPSAVSATGIVTGQYRWGWDEAGGACPECPPWLTQFKMTGFTWKEGRFDEVAIDGAAYTIGNSVNVNGDLVGETWVDGKCYGFVRRGGRYSLLDMSEEPANLNSWSSAYGINANGDIAGWYGNYDTWEFHPYLLRNGRMTTIDVPGYTWVTASAINDHDEVLVQAYENWAVAANYVWRDGTLTKIEYPGAAWTVASGINDAGQVVGAYGDSQGKMHGFVATRQ